MKNRYDIIFVTNIPSFYKINQWNEVSKCKKILVLFTGDTLGERNQDFFSGEIKFDYVWLNGCKLSQLIQVTKILVCISYSKLVIGGWDGLVIFSTVFMSAKKKNGCIVESSIYESTTSGLKGLVKRIFMMRISTVYASGETQGQLVKALNFKGLLKYTGGCGMLNYVPQPGYEERKEVRSFLYVGRLAEVKNLDMLIHAFNDLKHLNLSIAGFGPLEEKLRSIAGINIHFLGAINNMDLMHFYREADVFILPSKSEPWGLVVEEALNNGTPVIVSDKVGCRDDLVTVDTGLVFKWDDINSLKKSILEITNIELYNKLRKGVSCLDFKKRSKMQIDSYLYE